MYFYKKKHYRNYRIDSKRTSVDEGPATLRKRYKGNERMPCGLLAKISRCVGLSTDNGTHRFI